MTYQLTLDEEMQNITAQTPVAYALDLVGGNASRLARLLGVTPQAVQYWKKSGVIPPDKAKRIADMFAVPRKKLNPEIFG